MAHSRQDDDMNDEAKQDAGGPDIKRSEPRDPPVADPIPPAETAETPETVAEEVDPFDVLQALQSETADLKDRLMRALAETENTRRRAEKDRQDAARYGGGGLAKELIPVLDNLGRALSSIPRDQRDGNEQIENLAIGIEMTEKQFLDAFSKHGISRIEPKGEKFSYERHQAMSEREGTGLPAGTVVDVLQPGYMMQDRLLRPAMVIVAKGDPKAGKKAPEEHDHIDTTA